jgi:hypothetical protein
MVEDSKDIVLNAVYFDVHTKVPHVYVCRKCRAEVGSEATQIHGPDGCPIVVYYPASRYWKSPAHPNKSIGVFCSAECANT